MKLSGISLATVRKAISIYLDLAYGSAAKPRQAVDLDLPEESDADAVLCLFQKEVAEEIPGHACVRYTIRLGNRNYPFMKLLLQEHLVAGEFFFAVDTHDDMDIKPDFPDYEAWMAVQRFNTGLKKKIEAQFGAEGLHTAATIRSIVAKRGAAPGTADQGTVLVVDDEEDLADTVEALLRAKGYRVFKVYDGKSALRAALDLQPDLVLLDYELPEMDGLEVICRLREHEDLREMPVLLASAGRISMEDIRQADGFLAKPFQEDLLYEMVKRVLKAKRPAS